MSGIYVFGIISPTSDNLEVLCEAILYPALPHYSLSRWTILDFTCMVGECINKRNGKLVIDTFIIDNKGEVRGCRDK